MMGVTFLCLPVINSTFWKVDNIIKQCSLKAKWQFWPCSKLIKKFSKVAECACATKGLPAAIGYQNTAEWGMCAELF